MVPYIIKRFWTSVNDYMKIYRDNWEINSCLCYLAFLQKGSKTLWKEGMFFLLRSGSDPLDKGGTVHFFLCLKEKSSKKEANERAARPPARSGFCHESPVSSTRTRAVRTVLLPKAAVRFRTLRGSLGAYILPRLALRAGCLCTISDSPNP